MELNQSSSVPFAVNDPITGTDITKDVRLTAIEVGGQPSPYLKPNGDYSFTVVGADETDLTEEATFKLEVDWEGSPFPLEAKTDVTIKGTTDSQLVVRIVGSFDGHERVQLTNGFIVLFQVSYKGKFLGANEVGLVNTANTNSGLGVEYKGLWEDDITHRLDIIGKELGDSKWFMTHVFRPEEPSKTAVLQGYCDVVAVGATDLRIWVEPRYRSINGVKGDKQIVFCKYYRGVLPVAYNAPGMSVRLAGNTAADDGGVKFIEALPEGLVGEFLPEVSVKTNYIINVVMVYNGVTARTGTSWYCHKRPSSFPTQFGILPKYKVLANSDENWVWQVTDLNYPDNYDASNRPTAKGAVIEKGELVGIDMVTFANLYKEPFANIPLNSLKQFATRHAVDYRKQTYNIQAMYLKVRFEAETPLWEKQWQYGRLADYGDVIEAAPVVATYEPKVIDGRTEGFTPILLKAQQQRGDALVTLPGTYRLVSQTGAGAVGVSQPTNDKNELFYVSGKGVNGDFQATYEFTPTETAVGKQTFVINLVADTAPVLKMIPGDVQTVMFQEFTVPPFQVLVNDQDVTGQIRNVQLVPNNVYLKTDPNNPNKWSVADNPGKVATGTRGVFTYEVLVDGVWETHVGYGQYRIPAWDGITFKVSADYGRGVGVTTEIPISRNNTNRFTVWPEYKGKTLKSGFSGIVQVGTWFTAPIRIIGPTDDDLGVIIEYTAPDTSGPASNACVLTLTIDDTPGTTVGLNKWAGNFTGIYVTKGLYVLPITLVPSTQPYARPYSWDAKIYYSGKLLKPNDPRLSYEMSNAGATPVIIDIVGIEDRYMWFAFNRDPGTAGTFINRIYVTYNDGVKPPEGSGYVDVKATFSTTTLVPVLLKALKEPLGNAENIIPVEFQRSGYSIGKPTSVLSFSGKDDPSNGNALLGEVELIDAPGDIYRHALKFKSGWTGGKVIINMVAVFPDLADNWVLRDGEIIVPPAPITVTQAVNEIDGVDGRTTEVQFTLSQQRIGESETIAYEFPTATITPTGTVTGSIKGAYDATNSNGTFSVVLHGNGTQGPGTVTLTVTDPDGFEYPVILTVEAVIDSSLLVMTPITPSSVTGKAGTVTTMSGVTTYNGSTVVGWDNGSGNVHYSIEPEGWVEFVNPTKDNFDLKITRNSDVDISQEVFVVCNFLGMIAKQPVMVNIVKNMDTNAIVQNVEVWGRYTGYPFVVMAGEEDITNTILDAKPVNDDLVIPVKMGSKNNPAVNMWTVKGVDYANDPARTEVVTWQYRLPTDAADVVRTIDVVYNIAAYNGYSLTYITTKPYYIGVPLSQFQADFFIYRHAEPINDKPTNLGAVSSPILNSNGYSNFDGGQGRFMFQVINNASVIDKFGIPNIYKMRVGTGSIPGHDVIDITFITNTYSPSNSSSLTDFQPNPLVGKFGEEIHATVKAWRNGNPIELTMGNLKDPTFYPSGIIEMVPGTRNNEGFLVRFIADIDVNSKETEVTIRMPYATETGGSTKFIAKQMATVLKLTQAPGFQTTGSGDMENPVTLQQSVLNPE